MLDNYETNPIVASMLTEARMASGLRSGSVIRFTVERVALPPKRDSGGSTTTISRAVARPTFRRFAGGGSGLAAPLNEEKRGELSEALADHERGLTTTNPTIGCCWHAHRLEAGRKRARTLVSG